MGWAHAGLEVIEVLGIAILAVVLSRMVVRLRAETKLVQEIPRLISEFSDITSRLETQATLVGNIPELVSQLALRESGKMDEMLIAQAVMLQRLERIEGRLTHGSR